MVFKTLIERLNLKTRVVKRGEIKLYSKADYKAARGQTTAPTAASQQVGQAAGFCRRRAARPTSKASTTLRHPLAYRAGRHGANPAMRCSKPLGAHGVVRREQRHTGDRWPARSAGARPAGIADENPLTNEQTTLTEAIS